MIKWGVFLFAYEGLKVCRGIEFKELNWIEGMYNEILNWMNLIEGMFNEILNWIDELDSRCVWYLKIYSKLASQLWNDEDNIELL